MKTSDITSTSVNISWIVTDVTYTPENYTVHYNTSLNKLSNNSEIVKGTTDMNKFIKLRNKTYSIVLTDLYPGVKYNYYISTINTVGRVNSRYNSFYTEETGILLIKILTIFIVFIAPSGEPQNLTYIEVTSNNISFSWLPPLIHSRNGNITHYSLRCSYYNLTRLTTVEHLQIEDTSYLLSNLLPYTNYFCNLSASTNVGEGPSINIVVRTDEGSKIVYFEIVISLSF